jgi:hypothetical protein
VDRANNQNCSRSWQHMDEARVASGQATNDCSFMLSLSLLRNAFVCVCVWIYGRKRLSGTGYKTFTSRRALKRHYQSAPTQGASCSWLFPHRSLSLSLSLSIFLSCSLSLSVYLPPSLSFSLSLSRALHKIYIKRHTYLSLSLLSTLLTFV